MLSQYLEESKESYDFEDCLDSLICKGYFPPYAAATTNVENFHMFILFIAGHRPSSMTYILSD